MDWSKVYLLIEIAMKTGGFPKLTEIHKAANAELQRMNDEYNADAEPKPTKVKVDPLDKPTTLINEPVETERRL